MLTHSMAALPVAERQADAAEVARRQRVLADEREAARYANGGCGGVLTPNEARCSNTFLSSGDGD